MTTTLEVSVKGSGDQRREFFRMAVENKWDLLELRREAVQLEEVFRQLTVGEGAPRRNAGSKASDTSAATKESSSDV